MADTSDLDKLRASIGDLCVLLKGLVKEVSVCFQEIIASTSIHRLPKNRIRRLRARWINRFLEGRGGYQIGQLSRSDWPGRPGARWFWQSPPGIEAAPDIWVMPDRGETGHDEGLFLANRYECVLIISRIAYKTPTEVISLIESCGSPLERLASVLEDDDGQ